MKWKEQQDLFKAVIKEEMELLSKKGAEYASDQDCLDNFKRQGEELGLSPFQVLAVFMNKHYRSVQAFVRNGCKTTSNESIEGRLNDLRNYAFLALCLLKELESSEKKPPTVE